MWIYAANQLWHFIENRFETNPCFSMEIEFQRRSRNVEIVCYGKLSEKTETKRQARRERDREKERETEREREGERVRMSGREMKLN